MVFAPRSDKTHYIEVCNYNGQWSMIFAPRSDNGQIPYERYHLYGKLQSRPLLSEFFKDLIVMTFASCPLSCAGKKIQNFAEN